MNEPLKIFGFHIKSDVYRIKARVKLDEGARSASETIEGSALAFESIDNVECCDRLSLGMLSIGDRVSDDVLQEGFEDDSALIIDQGADSFDSSSSGESSDCWLGDTHDVLLDGLGDQSLGSCFPMFPEVFSLLTELSKSWHIASEF